MAKKRFSDLLEELAELKEEAAELSAPPIKQTDIASYLESFIKQGDAKVIEAFVNCLYVWEDKFVIYYNVKKDSGIVPYEQAAADGVSMNPSLVVCDEVQNNLVFGAGFIGVIMPRQAPKQPRRRKKKHSLIS